MKRNIITIILARGLLGEEIEKKLEELFGISGVGSFSRYA